MRSHLVEITFSRGFSPCPRGLNCNNANASRNIISPSFRQAAASLSLLHPLRGTLPLALHCPSTVATVRFNAIAHPFILSHWLPRNKKASPCPLPYPLIYTPFAVLFSPTYILILFHPLLSFADCCAATALPLGDPCTGSIPRAPSKEIPLFLEDLTFLASLTTLYVSFCS